METLLVVAVILITLAVVAQAGILIAMYVVTRRVADKAELLMNDSRRLMAPLESITSDLKTVANDLAETGKIARAQALDVQTMVGEARESLRGNLADIRNTVLDTVHEARSTVLRPIRHYAAIATGIATGIGTFIFGRKAKKDTEGPVKKEHPAA
jgi:hypothetical protein